ncbi:hypothetical protein GQ54DRAFT_76158 [Martensiomyces pterosporus]|nr:hypothetical protein GQ54DRAFT_76158 [Martensiomyces pterosporus]
MFMLYKPIICQKSQPCCLVVPTITAFLLVHSNGLSAATSHHAIACHNRKICTSLVPAHCQTLVVPHTVHRNTRTKSKPEARKRALALIRTQQRVCKC